MKPPARNEKENSLGMPKNVKKLADTATCEVLSPVHQSKKQNLLRTINVISSNEILTTSRRHFKQSGLLSFILSLIRRFAIVPLHIRLRIVLLDPRGSFFFTILLLKIHSFLVSCTSIFDNTQVHIHNSSNM